MRRIECVDVDQRPIKEFHIVEVPLVRHPRVKNRIACPFGYDDGTAPDRPGQVEANRLGRELHRLVKGSQSFSLFCIRDWREARGYLAMEIAVFRIV